MKVITLKLFQIRILDQEIFAISSRNKTDCCKIPLFSVRQRKKLFKHFQVFFFFHRLRSVIEDINLWYVSLKRCGWLISEYLWRKFYRLNTYVKAAFVDLCFLIRSIIGSFQCIHRGKCVCWEIEVINKFLKQVIQGWICSG